MTRTMTFPHWSTDGRQIAFVSDRGGTPQIYLWTQGTPACAADLRGGLHTTPPGTPVDRNAMKAGGRHLPGHVNRNPGGTPVPGLDQGGRKRATRLVAAARYIAFVCAQGKVEGLRDELNGTNVRVIHEGLDAYVSHVVAPSKFL